MTASLTGSLEIRATRAAQGWRPGSTVTGVRPLAGGASSLTFVARLGGDGGPGHDLVLKVAPPGLPPVRNRDVLRQARVLRALHGAPGVPVPAVRFDDPGDPPFFGMDLVAGECVEPTLAEPHERPDPALVRARGLDAARVLAAIHRLDPEAIGLGDEPVVTLGDEIDRWTRAFTTVPEELRGGYARCAGTLHATMPAALPPVVNHGDYRLGNTLCHGGRLTAVIDWEIWSLGDPRVDTSWLASFAGEARRPAPSDVPAGMPTVDELHAAYGAELPDMRWFGALARYKEAATMALLIKRGWKTGSMPAAVGRMVPVVPDLVREAEEILA